MLLRLIKEIEEKVQTLKIKLLQKKMLNLKLVAMAREAMEQLKSRTENNDLDYYIILLNNFTSFCLHFM